MGSQKAALTSVAPPTSRTVNVPVSIQDCYVLLLRKSYWHILGSLSQNSLHGTRSIGKHPKSFPEFPPNTLHCNDKHLQVESKTISPSAGLSLAKQLSSAISTRGETYLQKKSLLRNHPTTCWWSESNMYDLDVAKGPICWPSPSPGLTWILYAFYSPSIIHSRIHWPPPTG